MSKPVHATVGVSHPKLPQAIQHVPSEAAEARRNESALEHRARMADEQEHKNRGAKR